MISRFYKLTRVPTILLARAHSPRSHPRFAAEKSTATQLIELAKIARRPRCTTPSLRRSKPRI